MKQASGRGTRGSTLVLALASALVGLGCGPRIVTIKFQDVDEGTDYVVCEQRGTNCRGRREEDVPPTAYKPKLDVLVPKAGAAGACPHGPRTIEVVMKGKKVSVVGYTCAAPPDPCDGSLTDGLPPEAPAASKDPPDGSLTGGLPPEPPVAADEEESAP